MPYGTCSGSWSVEQTGILFGWPRRRWRLQVGPSLSEISVLEIVEAVDGPLPAHRPDEFREFPGASGGDRVLTSLHVIQ